MDRRAFLYASSSAIVAEALLPSPSQAEMNSASLKPMALGLLVSPFGAPEATIRRVHDLGFSNCFLSLDGYIGGIHAAARRAIRGSAGEVRAGCHHRRSRRPAAARVELPSRAFHHRPGSSQDPRGAHRRAAPGLGLRQAARHRARCRRIADSFPKIRPIRYIRARWKPSAPSPSIARATVSTS